MFYTVYKVTNRIDGKIYIGCHKTSDLDDGYMGSGKYLKSAQNKHGIENFEKEILEIFDKPEDMFEMESSLVNPDFVERKDTYNLKKGGTGGFDYINDGSSEDILRKSLAGKKASRQPALDKIKWLRENDKDWEQNRIVKLRKTVKEKYPDGLKTFEGRKHSAESKKKMSEARKGKVDGEKNPSFGTMWIHSLKEKRSKKIKKEELSDWENKGWLKGRKMKFL